MKPWADEIHQHIESWSARLGNLSWWPRYIYHFTDVQNAVEILQSAHLYSRSRAQRLGRMQNDNASPHVIQQTDAAHQNFVRFYFRPRTPTQYNNEGIRPRDQRELGGAHCPVPIFFCFDAASVLTLDESRFSNGNMGSSRVQYSSEREFFFSIPFEQVFHNRWLHQSER